MLRVMEISPNTAFPISDQVQEFMDRKRAQPGFGKRRYGVRIVVGRAYITLHKSAR